MIGKLCVRDMNLVMTPLPMKKGLLFVWRPKYLHCLLVVLVLGLFAMAVELPKLFTRDALPPPSSEEMADETRNFHKVTKVEWREQSPDIKLPSDGFSSPDPNPAVTSDSGQIAKTKTLKFAEKVKASGKMKLKEQAELAWRRGNETWKELLNETIPNNLTLWRSDEEIPLKQPCKESVYMTGRQFKLHNRFMPLPCGMVVGSSVTMVGKLRPAHLEQTRRLDNTLALNEVSHFVLEFHGLMESKTEEPLKILHVNPRLKGDWSNKSVIELNTCYRGQYGHSQRCDGSSSGPNDETVDGFLKCEKWQQDFGEIRDDSKTLSWLNRLVGRVEKSNMRWRYPFKEGHLFVFTVTAGWEGYHLSVDGRHVSSFPYRTGSLDEETTGIYVNGDADLHSIVATSLPSSHPKSLREELFQTSESLRAPPLPEGSVDLFIGVISGSTHFTERMAVRRTWMQYDSIKNSGVVARFFVALHEKRSINLQVLREADYYRDMVILPFMDHYDLLVLKTIAICEYAVQNASARYILKCDDDTFVRVDAVLDKLNKIGYSEHLFLGSLNIYHRPLRTGKWAVTLEEWPEEVYPPYANGAGYIISYNIAKFIATQHKKQNLELFKMEDVSMGLWVLKYNATNPVRYAHTWQFYQPGCENGCITAHYQSPRQMLCLWKKLLTTATSTGTYCC